MTACAGATDGWVITIEIIQLHRRAATVAPVAGSLSRGVRRPGREARRSDAEGADSIGVRPFDTTRVVDDQTKNGASTSMTVASSLMST